MASKSSKSAQAKTEQAVRRALAQLDTAVQKWYAENNPGNKEHYASATFLTNTEEDNYHVSSITLNSDAEGREFVDIKSRRNGYGKSN